MQAIKKKLKRIIKLFITYKIENDTRVYQLKYTPFTVKKSLIKKTFQQYGNTSINTKKIIFDNYMGHGYGCNCKYVTEELIRRGTDFDLVWIVKDANAHKGEFPPKVRLVEYGSKEAMFEYYTAAVWVCNYHLIHYWNQGLVKRFGQYYIQMWHGSFGIKKIEKNCDCLTNSQSWTYLAKKNSQNTDFWISNSFFEDEVYQNAFWSVKNILKLILEVQKEDGSFPRKFRDNQVIVDNSGGSTPSAVLPLVMAYTYFKDKDYLNAAKKAASYLENEIISKADYFSSTLDANCEDKEASLYAATATYYLALVTKEKERKHYAELTRQAAYFALSWYYLWDVPFAEGQMLGDLSFKSRGWGNVSVENNHIDVFIFDFVDVLRWLSEQYNEPRFSSFAEVISTSMRQLVPYSGHLCGIAREGYYPEVVQHAHWDYGKNGKGFYNDIFAPGWTVASLWELFTPGRAEKFLLKEGEK